MADVNITTSLQGIEAITKGFDQAMKAGESFGDKMEKSGKQVADAGKELTKFVTVPLVAATAGLLKLSNDYEAATNTIRNATGATGQTLQDLSTISDQVFKKVPADLQTISGVIGELNTRSRLTGNALQQMSVQVLEAARLTGTNASQLAQQFSQVIQVMGTDASDAGKQLDEFFEISQEMGIGLGRLVANVAEYGAVLRTAGLSADESAVLIAKMETAGISFSRVSPALNQALRKFADAGLDVRGSLDLAIQEIANAKDETEAYNKALELFGAEGATRAMRAIRDGLIPSLGSLSRNLDDSQGKVIQTGAVSRTFGEDMKVMGNNIASAFGPLSMEVNRFFRGFFDGANQVIGKIGQLVQIFVALPQPVKDAALTIAGLVGAGGPILIAVGTAIQVFAKFGKGMAALTIAAGPLTAAILGLAAAGVFVAKNWEAVVATFNVVGRLLAQTGEAIIDFGNGIRKVLVEKINEYVGKFKQIWNAFVDFLPDSFKKALGVTAKGISDFTVDAGDKLSDWAGEWKDVIVPKIEQGAEDVAGTFSHVKGLVKKEMDEMAEAAQEDGEEVGDAFDDMGNDVNAFGTSFDSTVGDIGRTAGTLPDVMVKPFKSAITDVLDAFTDLGREVTTAIGSIINSVAGGQGLGGIFGNLINDLSGVGGKTGSVAGLFQSLLGGGTPSSGGTGGGILDTLLGAGKETGGFFNSLFGGNNGDGGLFSGVKDFFGGLFGGGGGTDMLTSHGFGGMGSDVGGGGFFSGVKNFFGGIGGSISDFSNGLFGGLGGQINDFFGGGMLGNLATAGAGLLGNFAGGALGGLFTDKTPGSNIGATIGGALGAFGGPVGSFIGSTVGSLVDTLFGGKNKEPRWSFIPTSDSPTQAIGSEDLSKITASPFGNVRFQSDHNSFPGNEGAAAFASLLDAFAFAEAAIASALDPAQIGAVAAAVGSQGAFYRKDVTPDPSGFYKARFGKLFGAIGDPSQALLQALDLTVAALGQPFGSIVGSTLQGALSGSFATGGEGIFTRRSLIQVGEMGPERVKVEPLANGGGGGMALNINGPLYADEVTLNRLVKMIERKMRQNQGRYR